MPRFLIEVTHEAETLACARAAKILLETGSHFITHADFGCYDGDHRAWIIIEHDSKEEARLTIPPAIRADAHVTGLNKFTIEELDDLIRAHRPA